MAHDTTTFDHPYRSWGMRVFNWTGGKLNRLGVRSSLTPADLMKKAERTTRLSDWGDYKIEEPLGILMDSLEREARFSPLGRFLTRHSCVSFAANRLNVQDCLNQHPEIAQEAVRRPIFVIGLPRTGTTLLYNLLCQDPQARPLMSWETLWPEPEPQATGKTKDPRRARARKLIKLVDHMAPQLQQVHPLDPDGPEECTWLLANTFVSTAFGLDGKCDDYIAWVLARSVPEIEKVYQDYRRQLQVLQWKGAEAHWVLKSPAHLPSMGAIMNVFPDAGIVQTHRDPRKMMGSACSLFAISRGIYSDEVNPMEIGRELATYVPTILEHAIKARENDGGRVLDVHFRKLVKDPIGTVEKIYEHFQLPMSGEMRTRMQTWLQENPQHKHGVHRYELEQFGLTPEIVDDVFQHYCERFQVNDEAQG